VASHSERPDVVLVHLVSFFISALTFRQLLLEASALIFRIIQLAEAIGDLHLPAKISHRSVQSGSSGFCLESGDTAVGIRR